MDTEITPQFSARLRRGFLVLITLIVGAVMVSSLIASWNEPQVASRLELYQTDLLLRTLPWDGGDLPTEQVTLLRRNLLGETPLETAQDAYKSVRETAQTTLDNNDLTEAAALSPRLANALEEQAELIDLLDLRLGILQAEQGDIEAALIAWNAIKERQSVGDALWQTADALGLLWQEQPVPARFEPLFSQTLNGWFLNRALEQAYTQTQATEKRAQLQQQEVEQAAQMLLVLAAIGVLPVVGSLTGLLVLVFLGVQRLAKASDSLLVRNSQKQWTVPWTTEAIGWVLIGGFFFTGQLAVPVLISPFRGLFTDFGLQGQALYSLVYYLMMSVGAVTVLWFTIWSYRPLPEGWFRFDFTDNWIAWGVGGYLAALPLMLIISAVNQQIWQGQGGSNPLLQTVLEAQDPQVLAIFFTTAAIAAPLFEEYLFRGFLLPSLTRYMPVWGAILLSSFIFAIAHLSLSEVLPLMMLGIVLGVVYTRSRNLLAPMLLHSAWNSVTMLGLFLLGSSAG